MKTPPDRMNCDISAAVLRRNGLPKYWCHIHHSPAWGPDGKRLTKCREADQPYKHDETLYIDPSHYPGGVALWGAIPAVYDSTKMPVDRRIHVHARMTPNGSKVIDKTYDSVFVKNSAGKDFIRVDAKAASSYVASCILKVRVTHLKCPHCGFLHLDAGFYAVTPHRKHQCNGCGREFYDSERGVSNPVNLIKASWENPQVERGAVRVSRSIVIAQEDFPDGIQIWGSNAAILWTAGKKEEEGIHLHCYRSRTEEATVDNTFGEVCIDGKILDAQAVRYFMMQLDMKYLRKRLMSLHCPGCGHAHFDEGEDAIRPHTDHTCEKCSLRFTSLTRTKKVVSNPVVEILRSFQLAGGNQRVKKEWWDN